MLGRNHGGRAGSDPQLTSDRSGPSALRPETLVQDSASVARVFVTVDRSDLDATLNSRLPASAIARLQSRTIRPATPCPKRSRR
jgi:hypothetical protein